MLATCVYDAHLLMSQQVWLLHLLMTSLADVLLFNWQAMQQMQLKTLSRSALLPVALPCSTLPTPALLRPALPCYTCPAKVCPPLPYHALPCLALPCPATPCPSLPCCTLPCCTLPSPAPLHPALPWSQYDLLMPCCCSNFTCS